MKHLIFSSYDDLQNPYYAGGGAVAVHEIAKRLAHDFQVTVITGKYPGCRNQTIDGVYYRRVGLSYVGGKLGQIAYQLCLPFLAATADYDIWFESFTPPFSTACLQLFTTRPVVAMVQMLSGQDMHRKYKLPFHLIENLGLLTYKHLIVLTDHMKNQLAPRYPHLHITTIPNGISRLPRLKSSAQPTHILYLGRIEVDQKGLDLLLKGYAKTLHTPLPLYIAGSGDSSEVNRLKNLIKELHLDGRVHLLGRVSGSAKARAFRQAAFVIIPSRFETFPLVALESLSYAKALIAFDINGLKGIPENIAIKIRPFDVNQLSQAMDKLAIHPRLSVKLGVSGRRFAAKYTWDDIAQEYKKLIEIKTSN